MKIGIKHMDGVRFYLKYEDNEWELLESRLKELGLQKGIVRNGWGQGIQLEAWREEETGVLTELLLRNQEGFVDDINQPLWRDGKWNLAIFRVVPGENGEIWVPLREVPTILDLKGFIKAYKELISSLFKACLNMEISIKWKVKKISLEEERGREDEIQT